MNNNNTDIIIRAATDNDANLIQDLIFDIWINEYHFAVKKESFPDLQEIENYYPNAGGLFLLAVLNNNIVGTVACSKLNAHCFVLKRMFVKKMLRGEGVAQKLLDQLFDQIVYSNNTQNAIFFLSTKESEAIAAKKFYLKNGFRIIHKSELPDNFPFFYQDDLFMIRDTWGDRFRFS